MEEPAPGDLVLHNYRYAPQGLRLGSYLCGTSTIDTAARTVQDEPPEPGNWRGRGEYYRIDLRNFQWLTEPLDFKVFSRNYAEQLREEIEYHDPGFFPFTINAGRVRPNQGMYLTRVPRVLYDLLGEALGVEEAPVSAEEKIAAHLAFAEGERNKREVLAFTRNPALARAVKARDNYTCQLCGFRPQDRYGNRYRQTALECHHLDPLGERDANLTHTTLADVTTLCANCHRLVHARRPAMGLDAARRLVAAEAN
jgi:hypothetical protein